MTGDSQNLSYKGQRRGGEAGFVVCWPRGFGFLGHLLGAGIDGRSNLSAFRLERSMLFLHHIRRHRQQRGQSEECGQRPDGGERFVALRLDRSKIL